MRKAVIRIENAAVAPVIMLRRLCHMKLPTISCMPEDTGQYLVIVTDVVDIRGPSESVIEHVR
jgi:hypothetical protein